MQLPAILRILGLLVALFSTTQLPPLAVGLLDGGRGVAPFAISFGIILGLGILLWLPVRHQRRELRTRDGFMVVSLFWLVLSLFGAVPFMLWEEPAIPVADAIFEATSGLTTTGSTVLTGLDDLALSLLFYRQQLQWMGGMGIIVLAVAILPMLGIGGMQLYRAELPGPMKDAKLTPRITETAKALWYIYLSLTVACALAYWAAGMSGFDAVAHSFSTVAIGGFSTHDASMGYFNSPAIELIAVVFMLLSGMNFALHFTAWRGRSPAGYLQDPECRGFLAIMAALGAITVGYLYLDGTFDSGFAAFHHGLFQAVSIGTTAGFATADFAHWPSFLPVLLIFASFIGASGGSTGGGMKVMRFLLLLVQGMRELKQLAHPNAQLPVKLGGRRVSPQVVNAVWGFFAAYVASFVLIMLALMATGLDQVTAFSAVAATLNNLGPGLGDVSAHFGGISDTAKLILAFAMVLGRLEIFSLLILFTPWFWRR
ncbi:TrkH family potassium uptake protein [Thiohalospira sp.]|uniref:TrkH family potassium uptake protein n=1 Tax=Thiohalospira sp. TaxID=3080549 RepID=UPI00397EFE2F